MALAVAPLWFAARSTALGEPFADDFWFLQFSVLRHNPSWWDGGGCLLYWRPLARQAYYSVFGPLMLEHPLVLALLHALAFAAAGVLLYRALRPAWPARAAAVAGAFTLGLEASRTLLAWPSGAQDLGALLGLALVLHACSRGRTVVAVFAAVVAVLCKEVAAPLVLLATFAPFGPHGPAVVRRRWVLAGVVALWAAARVAVQVFALGAAQVFPPNPAALSMSFLSRLAHGLGQVALDAFSLGMLQAPAPWQPFALAAALGVSLAGFALIRSRRTAGWTAWGIAWFVASGAPLAFFWPDWAPFRSTIPALGIGVAVLAPFMELRPAWLVPLVVLRLATLLAAPAAIPTTSSVPPPDGAFMDFPHLTRLQRFMHDARTLLQRSYPELSHGSTIVRGQMPRGLTYALGEDRSLQAWYLDSTLRFIPLSEFRKDPRIGAIAALEFEPGHAHQLALVPIAAIRMTEAAHVAARQQRYPDALAGYTQADSAAPDSLAYFFHAQNAGARAFTLATMGHSEEALVEARAALELDPREINGRLVLADRAMATGHYEEAQRLLESVLSDDPNEESAMLMSRLLKRVRTAGASGPIQIGVRP